MTKRSMWRFLSPAAVLLLGLVPMGRALAADPVKEAEMTVSDFEKADTGFKGVVRQAAGYAVFPSIGKGGLGIGGAHGEGVLFEAGRPVGKTTMTQVTVGLQAGGQEYAQVILFKTPAALGKFKSGDFAFSANASAVAIKTGAAAAAKYTEGVAVFTRAKGGLMYEASLGGQKFKYEPFRGPSSG